MNGWQKIMKNERNKQANGAVCVCVCEELNFTYSSLESSLPALSLLFNTSTWRMSDLYARTKLQINLLKMIVKAVRCAGVYFQHTPPTCSRSASNSLSLSLSYSVCLFPLLSLARSVCSCSAWLHVSLMQYARIFAQKYWWFGKCALKRQNPLSCSHQDGRLTARQPGSLAAVTCWHLPVTSCQALNILAHEFSQSLRHNSAKHEKRISKTELQ